MFGILLLLCLASGLLRLQDLVRSPPTSKMEVHIRQGTVNTYRQVLREIKQRDINNIIVDTRTEHVHTFFRAVSCSTHQTKRSAEKVRSFVILTTSFRRLNIKKKRRGESVHGTLHLRLLYKPMEIEDPQISKVPYSIVATP